MKIAMVSEHASPLACIGGADAGGQNIHVAALSAALVARGHEVIVYTRADSPTVPALVTLDSGVRVEHVPAGPLEPMAKDALLPHMRQFGDELTRRWRDDPPDLVHAHFWMSGLAAVNAAKAVTSACAGRGAAIPVVQTFHALGTVKRRWQRGADTSPSARIGIERRVARSVAAIIATCGDEVAELRAIGAPENRVDVVPCGVDTDLFAPARTSVPRGRRPHRLLVIGRLVPRKGIEDAIRALAELPEAELVVIGGPDAGLLSSDVEVIRLRGLAARLGVGDRTRFTGRVAHTELPDHIRAASVVVAVPWYEPFGIVPLEAMACAVPVVGSAVGGLLDTVVPGETGLLVEPGDPAAIAAAVRSLLIDEDRRETMGAAGRRRVERLYSWPRIAEQTERVYRTVRSPDRAVLTTGAAR